MRDLKRPNAALPAYRLFREKQVEVFTPMKCCLRNVGGKMIREQAPFIPDLLFVCGTREEIDAIVDKNRTIQYRYLKGGYKIPMMVPGVEMDRFIRAVGEAESPRYYLPQEVTPDMLRRKVRIVGSPLDGYEGHLLSVRGSKKKYLLVELPGFFFVAAEVCPDYIELLPPVAGR
ncbi:UpxY family transcription antiterminator [Bacteroides sp. AN502(2024)]|uniref:UpxY family transcription antiterminator n=1 Tax=Bacteroides sp. AN502(2024) TaxID=3160599 RepID=UPI0035192184